VRSRDLPGGRVETAMDAAALTDLDAFLETRVLSFAQHYFEIGEYSHVSEDQPDVSWMADSIDG